MLLTILIADNHPVFRQGLIEVLRTDPGLEPILEAGDGETALRLILERTPAVAVLDIHMPLKDGFQVARAVRSRKLPTEVVFVTAYRDEGMLQAAVQLGVRGYILKDAAVREILAGVRAAVKGESFVSPAFLSFLHRRPRRARDQGSR